MDIIKPDTKVDGVTVGKDRPVTPNLKLIIPQYEDPADVNELNYDFLVLDNLTQQALADIQDLVTQLNNYYALLQQEITDRTNADAALKSGYEAADKSLKSTFEAADAKIREDFTKADEAIRSDYQAADDSIKEALKQAVQELQAVDEALKQADAAIRQEFAKADADLKTELLEADAALRRDLEAADEALGKKISALEKTVQDLATAEAALEKSLQAHIEQNNKDFSAIRTDFSEFKTSVNEALTAIRERLDSFRTATNQEVEDLIGSIGKKCETCEDCPCPPDFKDILSKIKPGSGGIFGGPPAASDEEVNDMMKDILDGCDEDCSICDECDCPHGKPNFGDILGSGVPGGGLVGGAGSAIDRTQVATADEVDNMLNDAFAALGGGRKPDTDTAEVETRRIASVNEVNDMLTDTLGKKSGD